MPFHTTLESKEDYEKAISSNPGKFVFIYLHEGKFPEDAEAGAAKFASTTVAYSADVSKEPKILEYFGLAKAPAAVIYKDGSEVKKFVNPTESKEEISATLSG